MIPFALLLPPAVTVDLDPVRAGVVTGVASAPEGVLRVELYVLPSAVPVAAVTPALPFGEVAFSLVWPADRSADLRVVATTALRGGSAETRWVLPAAPTAVSPPALPDAPDAPVAPPPAPPRARVRDRTGVYTGGYAETLPYAVPLPPVAIRPLAATPPPPLPRDRDGGVAVATGLLLLLSTAHVHRLIREDRS